MKKSIEKTTFLYDSSKGKVTPRVGLYIASKINIKPFMESTLTEHDIKREAQNIFALEQSEDNYDEYLGISVIFSTTFKRIHLIPRSTFAYAPISIELDIAEVTVDTRKRKWIPTGKRESFSISQDKINNLIRSFEMDNLIHDDIDCIKDEIKEKSVKIINKFLSPPALELGNLRLDTESDFNVSHAVKVSALLKFLKNAKSSKRKVVL